MSKLDKVTKPKSPEQSEPKKRDMVETLREYNTVVDQYNDLLPAKKELDAARDRYFDAMGGKWPKGPIKEAGEEWSHLSGKDLPNDIKTKIIDGWRETYEGLIEANPHLDSDLFVLNNRALKLKKEAFTGRPQKPNAIGL